MTRVGLHSQRSASGHTAIPYFTQTQRSPTLSCFHLPGRGPRVGLGRQTSLSSHHTPSGIRMSVTSMSEKESIKVNGLKEGLELTNDKEKNTNGKKR